MVTPRLSLISINSKLFGGFHGHCIRLFSAALGLPEPRWALQGLPRPRSSFFLFFFSFSFFSSRVLEIFFWVASIASRFSIEALA